MNEILKTAKLEDQTPEIQKNLSELLVKLNKVRELYGKPMVVTSGLRTMEDHLRIYREKGITDKSKIPMKSRHLFGLACDFADPNEELENWCKQHEKELLDIGIWLEAANSTPGWCHMQSVPYGSYTPGKSIYFNP